MSKNVIQSIEFISNQMMGLEFHLNPKWASTYSDHRINIRKHLYKKTKAKSVLNLQDIPKLSDKFVSISHCPVLGGFVLHKEPVGLDLEQMQRLSFNLIERISEAEETNFFPEDSFKLIWTIKESVYKCSQRLDKNMVSVQIQKNETLSSDLKIGSYYQTLSEFSGQKYLTLSWISAADDLCLSLSAILK